MRITAQSWDDYIRRLRLVNEAAAKEMTQYMLLHPDADFEALIDFAYGVSTRYGEAAATLACEMYDRIAAAEGARVPPAEPAETASYGEVAKAVRGTAKTSDAEIPQTVGRLVKQAGADTTMQNAIRDGAEFAWIPRGDTCAFCLTLGSRGWQKASRSAVKNGHAEHIHANCDCTYSVRFNSRSGVAGYDPEQLLRTYQDAEGSTPRAKINAMRRQQYAENREAIRAQQNAAYAARKGREE